MSAKRRSKLPDASNGVAEHNKLFGNCAGLFVLNSGANPHTWKIEDNRVTENNLPCPAGEEGGALSGIGILVLSATDIDIKHNVVLGNRIGTDRNDIVALPNGGDGVLILNAPANIIGGADSSAREAS